MANEIKWYNNPRQYTLFSIKPGQGPSKMDLLNALAYAYGGEFRVPPDPVRVQFKLSGGGANNRNFIMTAYARVLSISHEDGGGESFNITGYLSTDLDWHKAKSCESEFLGYYNTRTREGAIRLKKRD